MMEQLDEAKASTIDTVGKPEVALVLGSGLGTYADGLEDRSVVPYAEIPHMPLSAVVGHAGNLVSGTRGGKRVVAMQGRVHLYEGHPVKDVVFGVRLMAWLGAKTLIVTNAAGGISPSLSVGDLMVIDDHLNLTGTNSCLGPHEQRLGPRFLDMTEAYDRALVDLALSVGSKRGIEVQHGVYAGVMGPSYETPAEVRMLRTLGADAVGMSTVLEVIAARHMGLRVLGLSCISNAAAGLSGGALSHEEVTETASAVRDKLESLLSGVIEAL